MRTQKRNNAVYTGQIKRGVVVGSGSRTLVDAFYTKLNSTLLSNEEIEIIPPEQVHPTHNLQDQVYIVAYYCVSKILPEVTCLFDWGDKGTPRLRALAPIVDQETAQAARNAVESTRTILNIASHKLADAREAAYTVARNSGDFAKARASSTPLAKNPQKSAYQVIRFARSIAAVAAERYGDPVSVFTAQTAGAEAAVYLFRALETNLEAGNEAAYNRIIDLTNEMLESL